MNETILVSIAVGTGTIWIVWALTSLSSLASSQRKLAAAAERIAKALENSTV